MGRSHSASAPIVRLVVAQGKPLGAVVPVSGPRFTIGRDEGCQLRPHNELVSRRHAEIAVAPAAVLLRDLGSRNGTLLNGRAVTGPADLRDGDRLQVGPLVFTVSIQGALDAAAHSSEDEIAAWLVADEDGTLPSRPSDIPVGLTADDETGEAAARPVPAASPRTAARGSSDAAADLLKAMTRPSRPR